jgi:MarC family membrane protein
MPFFIQVASLAFPLFLLMDPIGNVPIFISLLKDVPPKRQLFITFRELIIALITMILFYFVGDFILELLKVQHSTILIAGGLILFLIALKMIFPGRSSTSDVHRADKEPFIVPLAIPLVAGPAVLATIMLYSGRGVSDLITVSAIILAWGGTTLILLSASFLKKILGSNGIIACERLMGLLLTLISVQMMLEGINQFLGRSSTAL